MSTQNTNEPREAQITENLRRAFQERASEAVPDKFLNLLEQLRAQDLEQGSAAPEHGEGDDDA